MIVYWVIIIVIGVFVRLWIKLLLIGGCVIMELRVLVWYKFYVLVLMVFGLVCFCDVGWVIVFLRD